MAARREDLAFQLIAGGYGKVFVFDEAFKRLGAYRLAERRAKERTAGVWSCGVPALPSSPPPPPPSPAAPPIPPPRDCHPSYAGACLDPDASDYDCQGGSGNGPYYTGFVRVIGDDPYRLDGDGDGFGCE